MKQNRETSRQGDNTNRETGRSLDNQTGRMGSDVGAGNKVQVNGERQTRNHKRRCVGGEGDGSARCNDDADIAENDDDVSFYDHSDDPTVARIIFATAMIQASSVMECRGWPRPSCQP